ncbi:ATP-grasp domain-containing protein [Pyxidicoccus trucidator]|uniref:ATP-grasp domain-containing protein n=1 Tax=Pyxidicoccus trucidator TaxID=2709662 RepID=UPI0013DA7AC4|nr:RimK domain-containing protein ATP-grasp [Pyxidicoccus trucidator]
MILLWGMPGDEPFDAVRAALEWRKAPYTLLDQRRVLQQRLELEVGPVLGGTVWSGEERVPLDEVSAVYTRVYDARRLPGVEDAGVAVHERVREVETALWSWVEEAPGRVVNRPAAMASNGSKPFQAALIEAQGFRVPETLVTTDPSAALEFWERHGSVIYKSVSGVRSIVSRLGPEHRERLRDVTWCPTQFQAYVPGQDVRVHVVGDEVFPAEIVSDAVDYRYARRSGSSVELRAGLLDIDVAERCRALASALGLHLAGLDLRRTPEGEWFCFEVNPSPCFTYYEHHTGHPIAATLAAFLAGAQK